jgi:hypothetical protein
LELTPPDTWAVEDNLARQDRLVSGPVAEMVTVDFVVPPEVGGVYVDLVAEFGAWVPMPMDPRDDGSFHMRIRLEAGRSWRYRFLVDGDRWINDWDAHDYVIDDGGCGMSLLRT